MAGNGSLNEVAVKVKEDSIWAMHIYYGGHTEEALELFKKVLSDSQKLKKLRRRDETVALCKLNRAAALIGTHVPEKEMKGKEILEALIEGNKDILSLVYVHYNLGMIISGPNAFQEAESHLSQALHYIDEYISTSEQEKNVLVLKEVTLERYIQILEEEVARLRGDQRKRHTKGELQGTEEVLVADGDAETNLLNMDNKISALKKNLDTVYTQLLGRKVEDERPGESHENIRQKDVQLLLQLANQSVKNGSKSDARRYADKCFDMMEKDIANVEAVTMVDLGIVYMESGHHQKAITCFLLSQDCISKPSRCEIDKSYIFQNIGAVHVIREKFEDATHAYKDALHALDGIAGMSERRAHIHLNLGFAYSQMGRRQIWKAFEAFFNAAKYAHKSDQSEENLRLDALKAMTLTAGGIVDYVGDVDDFVYDCVVRKKKGEEEIDYRDFGDIPELKKSVAKGEGKLYWKYMENIKDTVLNWTIGAKDDKNKKK